MQCLQNELLFTSTVLFCLLSESHMYMRALHSQWCTRMAASTGQGLFNAVSKPTTGAHLGYASELQACVEPRAFDKHLYTR